MSGSFASRATPVCLLILSIVGCSGGTLSIVPATGIVKFNGQPVEMADVMFSRDADPADTAVLAPAAIAFTGADGTFRLKTGERDGAAPGKYRVTVQKTSMVYMNIPRPLPKGYANDMQYLTANKLNPEPLLPALYSRFDSTPLTFEVSTDRGSNHFEINLEGKAPATRGATPPSR